MPDEQQQPDPAPSPPPEPAPEEPPPAETPPPRPNTLLAGILGGLIAAVRHLVAVTPTAHNLVASVDALAAAHEQLRPHLAPPPGTEDWSGPERRAAVPVPTLQPDYSDGGTTGGQGATEFEKDRTADETAPAPDHG